LNDPKPGKGPKTLGFQGKKQNKKKDQYKKGPPGPASSLVKISIHLHEFSIEGPFNQHTAGVTQGNVI
jgi:hypothetical protein